MKIKPFAVEEWMNAYEVGAKYNIAETCVDSVSAGELFALCGEDQDAFWRDFSARRLTYGDIEGAPAFKEGVCKLYRTLRPEEVVTTHGAFACPAPPGRDKAPAPEDSFFALAEARRVLTVVAEDNKPRARIFSENQPDGLLVILIRADPAEGLDGSRRQVVSPSSVEADRGTLAALSFSLHAAVLCGAAGKGGEDLVL